MVEQQLGLLRCRVAAHEAERDRRLTRAEAELVRLRKDLGELIAMRKQAETIEPALTQAASPDGPVTQKIDSAPATETPIEAIHDSPAARDEMGDAAPLPAASDEEVLQSVRLIAEFGGDMDAQHGRQLARMGAVEDEVALMRMLVQRERDALGLRASRG